MADRRIFVTCDCGRYAAIFDYGTLVLAVCLHCNKQWEVVRYRHFEARRG